MSSSVGKMDGIMISNANINQNGLNKGGLHLNRPREGNGLITWKFVLYPFWFIQVEVLA